MIAVLVALVYLLLVVGWTSARLIVGERWWWVAAFNTFPALVFAPVPLMMLLAALDRRPLLVAAAAIPMVVWLGLFGWRFVPHSGGALAALAMPPIGRLEDDAGGLRVMAFNVLYTNKDVDRIAKVIENAGPDLIALPELTPAMHRALGERLDDIYPFRLNELLPGARFGTGVYSRWPMSGMGSIDTGLSLRSAVVVVHGPDGDFLFVALHPKATLPALGSINSLASSIEESFRRREAQLAAVCRYVDAANGRPIILAGDFNMSELSDAYRCVGRRLQDAYRAAGLGYGHTWPTRHTEDLFDYPGAEPAYAPVGRLLGMLPSITRIDYVFFSEHWSVRSAKVIKAGTGSDHRPVLVTLHAQKNWGSSAREKLAEPARLEAKQISFDGR